ncbi:MAG: CYTH domain-containing protein [Nanoarchaeota archaeon]|nr:CYTH domain-containing protein [Nanoarchaeota archaeon]MBU1956272.1 CYTH domain-containing protein [Patescibacteria group bacterium]
MNTEFEVKILDVDVVKIRSKLNSLGAVKVGEKNMRRYIYLFDSANKNKWLRLRDEGGKVTLTIKHFQKDDIAGTKELEVGVGSFEKTFEVLFEMGLKPELYQENKRESYKLGDVEVEIDTWPKIPAYLEVEGKSKEDVERIVKLLGFEMSQTTSLDGEGVYQHYGLDLNEFKELRF